MSNYIWKNYCQMINESQRQKDERYMRIALQEAELAARENEVPIGAVIVIDDKVVAKAHNLTEALTDVTAHAEMQAITAASETLGGKYLKECTLYVTVEPCIMCAGALGWSQIKRVVYGATDEKRGYHCLGGNPLHSKTIVDSGVLENECREIMQTFFKSKR